MAQANPASASVAAVAERASRQSAQTPVLIGCGLGRRRLVFRVRHFEGSMLTDPGGVVLAGAARALCRYWRLSRPAPDLVGMRRTRANADQPRPAQAVK